MMTSKISNLLLMMELIASVILMKDFTFILPRSSLRGRYGPS